jgi:NAD(P)-dependent dehydrogenase (short-subunit alcohol dehydrogenase family)
VVDYAGLLRLDGKGFVVLGTGAGIGGATCQALSQLGARLLCVSRTSATAETAAASVDGTAMVADVTSRDDMEAVFAKAVELFGDEFSGVVDVVGIPMLAALDQADDATFNRQFDLVLRHAWLTVSIAGPILARNGSGSIVFISATEKYHPGVPLYVTAKAALNALVRNASVEFGPKGVRVNAVAAGRIRSSGLTKPSEETWTRISATVPLRRGGEPSEIAAAALYLASDLSSYVTGEVLVVDGGILNLTAMPG